MLGLMEYFIQNDDLKETLEFYGEVFIKGVLVPCLEWRSGMPNTKIREGAIICLKKLLERGLVEEEVIYASFTQIFDNLKNCLDDDYTSSIRFIATVFFKTLIEGVHEHLTYEDYKTIYPELLKRLDDS
jgi:hypothetical protein